MNSSTAYVAPGAAETIERLQSRFGPRLVTSTAVRAGHGRGEGLHQPFPPDAVIFAESIEEIAIVAAACTASGVPIVPFGAGTSLEGQIQAIRGGISLDLSRMDNILEVSAEDLDCRVQAGVTREALNLHLRDQGLFFPLDPGANASLGGMAATRASGTNAVRYGTMLELVLGLTVVTSSGEIIRTGGRARKSAAGYDLTRLYIGSEGTLGIIGEIQLRLFGIPERISSGICQFGDVNGAVQTAVRTLQTGIPVARVELLDELQMKACIEHSKLEGLMSAPTLFLEFHGSPAAVDEQVEQVRALASELGGHGFRSATATEERNRLWKARHEAYWAARALAPGRESIATDACVPLSELARCIRESQAEAAETGLICPIVGHVGDGNFHMLILFDPRSVEETRRAEALATSVGRRAIACGGTCTGEHGIGLHKLALLREEHGQAVRVMQQVKAALDPRGILNPGKTVPSPDDASF